MAGAGCARGTAAMAPSIRDYKVIKKLGAGSFGTVMLVEKEGKQYCMKKVDVRRMTQKERQAARDEAKILHRLQHPNIVHYEEQFIDGGTLCIVMELAEDGDLHARLKRQQGKLLPEATILDWFVQICLALQHCHRQHILHRDIKTQNIFTKANGRIIKVGDFGISKVLEATCEMARTKVGTPYYLSPEICLGKRYDHKSDVWSLGVLLYELTTLRYPFTGTSMGELSRKITRGKFAPPPSHFGADLRELIKDMLCTNPEKRPSIDQILGRSCCWRRAEVLQQRNGAQAPTPAPVKPPVPSVIPSDRAKRVQPKQQNVRPSKDSVAADHGHARDKSEEARRQQNKQPKESVALLHARARAKAEAPAGRLLPHTPGAKAAADAARAVAARRPNTQPPDKHAIAARVHPAYRRPGRPQRRVSAPVLAGRRADGCVAEMRRQEQHLQAKLREQRNKAVLPAAKFVPAPRRDAVHQKASVPFLREQQALLAEKRGRAQLKKRRENVRAGVAHAMQREHRRPRAH